MREVDYSLRISLIIYSPQKHNGFLIIAAFWDSKSSSCFTPKNFSSFKTHRLHFWWFPFFFCNPFKIILSFNFHFSFSFFYFSLIMPRTSSLECNRKILSLFFSLLFFTSWCDFFFLFSLLHFYFQFFLSIIFKNAFCACTQ